MIVVIFDHLKTLLCFHLVYFAGKIQEPTGTCEKQIKNLGQETM